MVVLIIGLFISIFSYNLFLTEAHAIPVFARKYKTSCQTCHVAFPRLNAFGEAFRMNGYQFPQNDEGYVKEEPLPLGSPAWKKVWPEGIWPGQIPAMIPIALRVESLYRYDDRSEVTHDFTFPQELELLTGGTFGEDISFYGEITLFEEGETGKVGRLFLQFDNLFDSRLQRHLLNLKIGQFVPAAVPFASQRRLTLTDYLFNSFKVGKNNFQFSSAQRGLEVNGIIKSRFEHAFGAVNGNGTEAKDKSTDSYDNNSKKDIYIRLGYKLGGIGLDVTGMELRDEVVNIDLTENSIKFGAFGYLGENRIKYSNMKFDDKFYRYGFDLDTYYQNINLFGAILLGKDDNPSGNLKEIEVTAYLVEANYLFYPWLIGILRYEETSMNPGLRIGQVVPNLTVLIRANLKCIIEAQVSTKDDVSHKIFAGLDYAY